MDFDETLHHLCQDHGISVVYLFDVRARGRAPEEDEAQVGLLFAQPKGSEQAKAVRPALLRSFQDLFGAERIGLAYLQEAGPLFQYQGIRGRLMYLADDAERAEFEDRVVRDYLDFAFEMRLFQEEAAGEEGGG
jgi:hypothetical protein